MNYTKRIVTLGIMLALVVIGTGVSFAYFTVQSSSAANTSSVGVKGAVMKFTFSGGNNINIKNIYPKGSSCTSSNANYWAKKTFTVTSDNTTGVAMKYDITLNVTKNEFPTTNGLTYTTGNSGTGVAANKSNQTISNGAKTYPLGTGTVAAGSSSLKHTYNLYICYPAKTTAQNDGQGKKFEANIKYAANGHS